MGLTLFASLQRLYDQELYKSAIELGEIILKSYVRNKTLLTPCEFYQSLAYLGHSYYLENEYELAEGLFRQALAARRLLQRNDLPANIATICEENELKFKTAQCLSQLRHSQEAIKMLETIPVKQRAAKMHYLYAQLNKYRSSGTAVFYLKEVLKEHPLALDVAEMLLEMGVSGLEVNSLIVDATHWPQCEWLANWIEAHAFLYAHQYKKAAAVFEKIENDSPIQNHYRMLVQIGKCHFYDGAYDLAMRYLERANTECPQLCGEGLILMANLLCRENRLGDLERLTAPSMNVAEYSHEHWFILALRMFFSDRYERVDYFLDKARGKSTFLDVEVALLKANVYTWFQKTDQALEQLRSIMKAASHRFELYKNFVEIYTKRSKFKDAEFYAQLATKALGKTPRTLMLFAKTYERDPAMKTQIKTLLWRIHKMDEHYLPAIYMLVDLLVKEKEFEEAVRILRLQVVVQPNARMATMMGDICVLLKEHANALGFYNMAVRLDPTCQKAINALNNMAMEGKRGGGAAGDISGESGICNVTMEKRSVATEMAFDGAGDESVGSGMINESGLVQNETLWSDVDGEMNNN